MFRIKLGAAKVEWIRAARSTQLFGVNYMVSEELKESWKRTEGFLRDARSHFSEAAEALCSQEMQEFSDFLGHNELELALDMLDAAFEKSDCSQPDAEQLVGPERLHPC